MPQQPYLFLRNPQYLSFALRNTINSIQKADNSAITPQFLYSLFSGKSIIIGSVAGGLLLIVAIACIIIYIGRRKRLAVYRDRHQLLTDDEDDLNIIT